MKQDQYDRLSKHAHEMQKVSLEQVAVADLIREAIDVYVEVLDEEQDEVEN
jgi:histidinol-phosphate/aromatic aminotransferase/cobyric acid decarboxylase-like protein